MVAMTNAIMTKQMVHWQGKQSIPIQDQGKTIYDQEFRSSGTWYNEVFDTKRLMMQVNFAYDLLMHLSDEEKGLKEDMIVNTKK